MTSQDFGKKTLFPNILLNKMLLNDSVAPVCVMDRVDGRKMSGERREEKVMNAKAGMWVSSTGTKAFPCMFSLGKHSKAPFSSRPEAARQEENICTF